MICQINEAPGDAEGGQAMVEYALLLLVVAIAVFSFSGAADSVLKLYQDILTKVVSVL